MKKTVVKEWERNWDSKNYLHDDIILSFAKELKKTKIVSIVCDRSLHDEVVKRAIIALNDGKDEKANDVKKVLAINPNRLSEVDRTYFLRCLNKLDATTILYFPDQYEILFHPEFLWFSDYLKQNSINIEAKMIFSGTQRLYIKSWNDKLTEHVVSLDQESLIALLKRFKENEKAKIPQLKFVTNISDSVYREIAKVSDLVAKDLFKPVEEQPQLLYKIFMDICKSIESEFDFSDPRSVYDGLGSLEAETSGVAMDIINKKIPLKNEVSQEKNLNTVSRNLELKEAIKHLEMAHLYAFPLDEKNSTGQVLKIDEVLRQKVKREYRRIISKCLSELEYTGNDKNHEKEIEQDFKNLSKDEMNVLLNQREIEGKKLIETKFKDMYGLKSAEEQMYKILKVIIANEMYRYEQIPTNLTLYNMAIMGNPGTGKTTVAKIFSELLHLLGMTNGKFTKIVDPLSLGGTHVGKANDLVKEAVNGAAGGVLFIDEFPQLKEKKNNKDFGSAILTALMNLMTEQKDLPISKRVVFIFAGYEKPMLELLKTCDDGMIRRIQIFIKLEDTNADDLSHIAMLCLRKNYFRLQPYVREGWLRTMFQTEIYDKYSKQMSRYNSSLFPDHFLQSLRSQIDHKQKNVEDLQLIKTELFDKAIDEVKQMLSAL